MATPTTMMVVLRLAQTGVSSARLAKQVNMKKASAKRTLNRLADAELIELIGGRGSKEEPFRYGLTARGAEKLAGNVPQKSLTVRECNDLLMVFGYPAPDALARAHNNVLRRLEGTGAVRTITREE